MTDYSRYFRNPNTQPFIEFRSSINGYGRYQLNITELREIGDFTRENILKWLDTITSIGWEVDILPLKDFHAVCGDIEIPWATEEARQHWNEIYGETEKASV